MSAQCQGEGGGVKRARGAGNFSSCTHHGRKHANGHRTVGITNQNNQMSKFVSSNQKAMKRKRGNITTKSPSFPQPVWPLLFNGGGVEERRQTTSVTMRLRRGLVGLHCSSERAGFWKNEKNIWRGRKKTSGPWHRLQAVLPRSWAPPWPKPQATIWSSGAR